MNLPENLLQLSMPTAQATCRQLEIATVYLDHDICGHVVISERCGLCLLHPFPALRRRPAV